MTETAPAAVEQTQAPTGQGNTAWYEGHNFTPEDIGFIQNKAWDSPVKAVEAYKNLEKFHGVPADQILKLPKGEEPWDGVWNKLGRPEKVEGYGEVKVPDGVQVDADRVKWADSVVHKIGLNKAQRDALIAETATFEQGLHQEAAKQIEIKQTEQLNSLKNEWGQAFNERSELGRRACRAFLPGDDKQALLEQIEGAIGTANTLKLFASIGEKIGEDKIPDTGARPFGYTKEQAASDRTTLMSELSANKERLASYNEGKGPDYDKMQKLNKIIAQG